MIRFDFPLLFVIPYLFVFGAALGSFLNVCVHRLPGSERFLDQIRGLWSPPSHCPRCGRRILLRDNLPVLGWLLLRGRCRFCRSRIALRYPLIELANGLLFVVVFLCEVPMGLQARITDSCVYSPLGPQGDPHSLLFSPLMICFWRWLYHMVLLESLLVASLIDMDLRIIPDGATLPAMAVGVLVSCVGCLYLVPVWFQDVGTLDAIRHLSSPWFGALLRGPAVPHWIMRHPHLHGLSVSLAGLVGGGGSVWLVRVMGHWVLKREAMGFGDVVLMATIGSFLGWQPTLVVFFVAPVCALAVVAACWIVRRDREIPYGPYLSLATLIVLLGWKQIWPHAERMFSFGIFVPAMGVCVVAMLFLSLQVTQWTKRLLGIPDYDPSVEQPAWESGDQLFHYAGDRADRPHDGWNRAEWPGLTAGRGALFEQRWRNGRGR